MRALNGIKARFKRSRNVIGYGVLCVAIAIANIRVKADENKIDRAARDRADDVAHQSVARAAELAHESLVRDYRICVKSNERFGKARSVFLATQRDTPIPKGAIPSQLEAIHTANARRALVRALISSAFVDEDCGIAP